jgi:hypothetical protein
METRHIKSSLKHEASYAPRFGKVPFTFSIQIFTFPYSLWVTLLVDSAPSANQHTSEGDLE